MKKKKKEINEEKNQSEKKTYRGIFGGAFFGPSQAIGLVRGIAEVGEHELGGLCLASARLAADDDRLVAAQCLESAECRLRLRA